MRMYKSAAVFLIVLVATAAGAVSAQAPEAINVVVYKSPFCGCCSKWIEHLRANGFNVKIEEVADLTGIHLKYGVASRLASCHTGVVGGYVVEGHVPADLIRRLLKERPKVVGLAVPGMTVGSPGMEGPNSQPYDILAFDREGNTRVYASR